MDNPVNCDPVLILDLEQDTVLSDAKPVFRAVIGQLLHIACKAVGKAFKCVGNPRPVFAVAASPFLPWA